MHPHPTTEILHFREAASTTGRRRFRAVNTPSSIARATSVSRRDPTCRRARSVGGARTTVVLVRDKAGDLRPQTLLTRRERQGASDRARARRSRLALSSSFGTLDEDDCFSRAMERVGLAPPPSSLVRARVRDEILRSILYKRRRVLGEPRAKVVTEGGTRLPGSLTPRTCSSSSTPCPSPPWSRPTSPSTWSPSPPPWWWSPSPPSSSSPPSTSPRAPPP